MAITISEPATSQTLTSQPVSDAETTVDATSTATVDASAGVTAASGEPVADTATQAQAPITQPVVADIQISPEALKQITALSQSNRAFKAKLAQLEKQAIIPADTQAKLDRLATLEAALTSPRKWLALANKTLEEVAEDTLAAGNEVSDPRVDTLAAENAQVRKELDEIKKAKETEQTQATEKRSVEQVARAVEYAKSVIGGTKLEDGSLRWERISKDDTSAQAAVDASIIIFDRDYAEKKDDTGAVVRAAIPVDNALAHKVLQACLDEAEAFALAKELLDARKNGAGQARAIPARSKGLEIREESASTATTPTRAKPTIDDARGPTRSAGVQRGQTDVRTARARALKIAGAE